MGPKNLEMADTIVALATAPGPSGRAIVRVSGPAAAKVVGKLFERRTGNASPALEAITRELTPFVSHCLVEGHVKLPDLPPLPADLYCWRGPKSYTGQDVAELHTISCPPLVDLLVAEMLKAGGRAARPGEFTLRAFLAGKLDLTRAEAILAVIEAGDQDELKHALKQLAGGIGRPMQELREDLLNLLADVEAALDFADEDISFIAERDLLLRISKGLALLITLQKQIHDRSVSHRPFRAVLAGKPNAGKSSLFNALTGARAIISPEPGTTRDYLVKTIDMDGFTVELVDTAGLAESVDSIERLSQRLAGQQTESADLVLLCVEPGDQSPPWPGDNVVTVATKGDLGIGPLGQLATSVKTGQGLQELRALLAGRARSRKQSALAPSLSRCADHVEKCLANLRRAHHLVLEKYPPELLALELRDALEQLGAMVGAVYTDDLLERIFSRFCIGK